MKDINPIHAFIEGDGIAIPSEGWNDISTEGWGLIEGHWLTNSEGYGNFSERHPKA